MLLEELVAMDGNSGRRWVNRSNLSDDLKQRFGTQ
jgi:hypothetical protein